MKRILSMLIITVTVFALFSCLSLTALASTEDAAKDTVTSEKSDTGSTYTEQNPFSAIYDFFLENADKILSALAFLCSFLLIFAYKRGLIPIVNKGLSAIGKSAGNFEKAISESLSKAEKNMDFLTERFCACENTVEIAEKSIDSICERLDKIDGNINAAETVKQVMLSQIDMLYEIFMHSSLPQYSKDALGERVAEMKKSISQGEQNVH